MDIRFMKRVYTGGIKSRRQGGRVAVSVSDGGGFPYNGEGELCAISKVFA